MFSKSLVVAALAACSLAAPGATKDAPIEAAAALSERSVNQKSGVVILFPETNYGGKGPFIYVPSGQPNFCQQLQPAYKGTFSIKSYYIDSTVLSGWTNANCAGAASVFIAPNGGGNSSSVSSANFPGILSFQTSAF